MSATRPGSTPARGTNATPPAPRDVGKTTPKGEPANVGGQGNQHDELVRQNEELHRVLLEMQEDNDQFKSLFEQSNVGMSITRPTGELRANRWFCEILGYSTAELDNAVWQQITHPDDIDLVQRQFDRMLSGDVESVRFENRLLSKDGSVLFAGVSSTLRRDAEGNPDYFLTEIIDITDRVTAQRELWQTEALLRAVADNTSDAVYVKDLEGHYLLFNEAAARFTGKSPADVIGKDDTFLFPAEEAAAIMRSDRDVIAGGVTKTFEERATNANGELAVFSSTKGPVRDSSGKAYGLFGIARDRTQQATMECALLESQRWLNESQRVAQIGHYIYDIRGDHWDSSPALSEVFGIDDHWPRDLDGWLQIAHPDEREELARYFGEDVLGERHPFDIDYRIVRPNDGAERWVHGLGTVKFDDDDRPTEMFGVIQDITDNKLAEERRGQDLERIRKALSSTVRIVSQVVETRDPYTAGHERRVSELAARIAEEMGLPAESVEDIRVAALIHDVGKMSVPAEILSKPGRLTDLEFELIKGHSEAGYKIIASADMEGPTAEIVFQHHERCDGSGYPRGLRGDELLDAAKIIMVADVVEAMSSHRPYRASLGIEPALAEIERGSGQRFDASVVETCVKVFREGGFQFSEARFL